MKDLVECMEWVTARGGPYNLCSLGQSQPLSNWIHAVCYFQRWIFRVFRVFGSNKRQHTFEGCDRSFQWNNGISTTVSRSELVC